jgi:hypothetical protein
MTVRRSVGFVKAIRVMTQREKQMETKLPERINVMKVISYDVQNIMESIVAMDSDRDFDSITLEEVMEQVEAWVEEDFPADRIKDLIIQDQDGEEL